MTIKTLADLRTEADTNFADNTTGDITPQDVREFSNNVIDSIPFQDITNSGTHNGGLEIDMNYPVQNITLDGHVTNMTTASRSASKGKAVKILFDANGADRNLVFSSSWQWMGSKPSGIPNTEKGILTLSNFGSAETDIIAAYSTLGDGS